MSVVYGVEDNYGTDWFPTAKEALTAAQNAMSDRPQFNPIYIFRCVPRRPFSFTLLLAALEDNREKWAEESKLIAHVWPLHLSASEIEQHVTEIFPPKKKRTSVNGAANLHLVGESS